MAALHADGAGAAENADETGVVLYPGETVKASDPLVSLLSAHAAPVQGSVYVTNFRLIFRPAAADQADALISLPLGIIEKVDKMGGQSSRGEHSYGIDVLCKDMRTLRFSHRQVNHTRRHIFEALLSHAFPSSAGEKYFAFLYKGRPGSSLKKDSDTHTPGWLLYDPVKEMQRMGVPSDKWKTAPVNKDYRVCATYPEVLTVPASVSQDTIEQVAAFRSKGRLPALCYLHKRTQASLTRCSQPRVGALGKRSQADEGYIQTIRQLNPTDSSCLYIKDARPRLNARANQAKGLGYESASNYPNCELTFLNIHNIHVMRDSLKKIRSMCWPQPEESHWFLQLEQSGWLKHLKGILTGAVQIVELMEKGSSVLIHCSDGWDRTAQLSALSMLIMDPYYRTLEGFAVLIEKEWISFGHKFAQRLGLCDKNHSDDQRSPVFLQFVDCVWQITQQYKCAFEFNDQLLVDMLDEMYSCYFGTFLYNCERERTVNNVREQTLSFWDHVLENRDTYINHLYSPAMQADVLRVSPSMRNLQLWKGYYVRWAPEYLPQESEIARLKELQEARRRLEAECQELQRKLEASGNGSSST